MKLLIQPLALATALLVAPVHADVPHTLNYQGRVAVGTPAVNFEGTGQFRFALVNTGATETYWTNDGTNTGTPGGVPTAAVALTVTKGLYSVALGDNMTAVPVAVFDNTDVRLRVWFNDGVNGSQLLTPDQSLSSVGFAMKAASADSAEAVPAGAITGAMLANGAVTSANIAAGTVLPAEAIAGTSQTALANTSYTATSADLTRFELPATANVGDVVEITGVGAGGWEASFYNPSIWTARESARSWHSVASSADGSKLVAVVLNGQIYTSTDSGVNWTARDANRDWRSVASSADGSKLVAGVNNGYIYTSSDSGLNWTPRMTDTTRKWYSVASSADGSKLVAGASNGQLYTSTDSGVSWTARESVRSWFSLASSADGSKLVAGVNNGYIYTSIDSGLNWTEQIAAGNQGWRSVASSADGSKLVAGDYNGFIYTSTDSGVSWTPRDANRNWRSVASSTDGSKLVAGDWDGRIYTSSDSGVTWTPQDSDRKWGAVASSNDGSKLVAGIYGDQIYTSSSSSTVASGPQGAAATLQYLGNDQWAAVGLVDGAVGSPQLASNLTLGGTTTGTFSGTFDGNATGFTGSLAGDVTGTQEATAIAAGAIINADVNAAAAIDATKLGTGVVSNTEFNYLNNVTSSIQTQLNGKVATAGDTMTGMLTLPAGTTTLAPLKLQAGVNRTTPLFGAVEFDGTDVFVTNNSGSPTRKTLAFTDSTITAGQIADGAITAAMIGNGAVTSASIADNAITSGKIAPAFYTAAVPEGNVATLNGSNGSVAASVSFDRAFATVPDLTLPDGWSATASETGFSATFSFSPVTVDSGSFALDTSMATVGGRPGIAYRQTSGGTGTQRLKFAIGSDAKGTSWSVTQVVIGDYTAFRPSLAVIDGCPAVSYLDLLNQTIMFVIAQDALGSTWGTPVAVATIGSASSNFDADSALALVNGKPAICFRDITAGKLKYVISNDARGASWGTPVIVDGAGGGSPSLAVVEGRPAVAYSKGGLVYSRATDATGSGWAAPAFVGMGSTGTDPTLAIVNGRPAACYLNGSFLVYVRALDATGDVWSNVVTLDFSSQASLAVVDNRPIISYYGGAGTGRDIKILMALDADGVSWGDEIIVDQDLAAPSGAFESGHVAMTAVNGNAVLSYYDHELPYSVKSAWFTRFGSWTARDPDGNGVIEALSVGVADGGVTSAAIADGAVTGGGIADGTVTAADLDAGSIGLWSVNGADIYRSSGKVGIGTSTPTASLDVVSDTSGGGNHTAVFKAAGISGSYQSHIHFGSNGDIYWRSALPAGKVVLQDLGGNVGIGTATPDAPLHVGGHVSQTLTLRAFLDALNVVPNISIPNNTQFVSIHADGSIRSDQSFIVASDERIKDIESRSDGVSDLERLRSIEIMNYSYKDKVSMGGGKQKKVIAQQVEEVYPLAVNHGKGVVPDIYKKASVEAGWVRLRTDLEAGERVRLITEKEERVHEVLEVKEGAFRTDGEVPEGAVFVYGREVDDFRTVDYDAISMLNVSATQELARRLETENTALKKQLAEQGEQLAELKENDQARDAKLASIERLLRERESSAVRTVSIGKENQTITTP